MKKIIFTLAVALLSLSAFAQSPFEVLWTTGGEKLHDRIAVALKASDDSFYIGGDNSSILTEAFLYKYDINGNEIWHKIFEVFSPSSGRPQVTGLTELPGGNIVAILSSEGGLPPYYNNFYKYYKLFVLDSQTGDIIWDKILMEYGLPDLGSAEVELALDGNLLIHGQGELIKVNANDGELIWRYEQEFFSEKTAIAIWNDQYIIFSKGSSFGGFDVIDENGNQIERITFPAIDNNSDLSINHTVNYLYPQKLIATHDGGVLIIGTGTKTVWDAANQILVQENPPVFRGLIFKYNENLELIFMKEYETTMDNEGLTKANILRDAVELADNHLIIIGSGVNGDEPGEDSDLWLFEINEEGDLLWETFFGGSLNEDGSNINLGTKMISLSDDDFIIASQSAADPYTGDTSQDSLYIFRVVIDRNMDIENSTIKDLAIYPNPTRNKVYFSKYFESVKIYDLQGRLLKSVPSIEQEVDLSELSNGIYLLQVSDENGDQQSYKVIKN